MAEKWFLERAGEAYGPVDVAELGQWIADGRVDATDLVWPDGSARDKAVEAAALLHSMGLTLPVDDVPLLAIVDDEGQHEPPIMDAELVMDDAPELVDHPPSLAILQAGTAVPDWVQALASAVEAERRKPKAVRAPDWLEDVRQAEKALRWPARRGGPRR